MTAARSVCLAAACTLPLAAPAAAQPLLDVRQELDFDRPESWAMKYVASVNLFTGLGVPRAVEPGEVELGFEAAWVPTLSDEEATVGFNGTKREEINRTSIFGRVRLSVGLPGDLTLDLSYLPPLADIDGVEPDLLALGVERPVVQTRRTRAGLRLTLQRGSLEGDITCPAAEAAAGDDPVANPFRCEAPSRDEMTLRTASLEAGLAFLGAGRWEPHVALAAHFLDLEFAVDARHSGILDRTVELTDGWTWSAAAGVGTDLSQRLRLTGEIFYTPLEVVRPPATTSRNDELLHARVLLTWRLRGAGRGGAP